MGRTIRESLDKLVDEIDNYVPPTKWEQANARLLKGLKIKKKSLEYALERNEELARDRERKIKKIRQGV